MVNIKELEDVRGYLVDIAIKLEVIGEEKKAFSSIVDWLTYEIVRIQNE